MAWQESGGNKFLLCFGLVLFVSSFCYCTRLTKLKALDGGNSTLDRGQPKGSELRHGRLLIGQRFLQGAKPTGTKATKNLLDIDANYQADMGWGQPKQPEVEEDSSSRLNQDNMAVERLLKMEPKVECTGDSMKLQVQDASSTPGSLFFVDRGSRLSPLSLSKLPPSCGYSFRSTRTDLVLVAPYDGCFVAHEEDSYVLPLRWLGLPVRMSCPLMKPSSPNPPMVTCHSEGMVVKTEWTVSVAKIKVNLNGNWEPLMKASPRCGFSVVVHPEGVVVSVRYAPCLEKKDGMYTLGLSGDGETKMSCPSLSPAQLEPTKSLVKGPEKPVSPSNPPHNSASTHDPEPPKKHAQSAVPQVPGFHQNPRVPDKKPNHINQPQLPYPFYPNFFYPYPANPDTKPTLTVQPTTTPVTKKNGQQSQKTVPPAKLPLNHEGQVPQPFVPFPFYPWPAQPEPNNPPTEPPLTKPPPAKENFLPNQFNRPSQSPQKPVEQSAGQPEDKDQKPYYPPFYPLPPKHPAPGEPQGQIYQPFYPYPFLPQSPYQMPVPTHQTTPAPKGQVQQPLSPLQPEVSKPKAPESLSPSKPTLPAPESKLPPQPEAPQGQVYQPFYPNPLYPYPFYPEPENKPATKPTAVQKPSQPSQPEAPQGQVHQTFYPYPIYPQPEPENQPATKPTAVAKPSQPSKPEVPQGQVYQPFYPNPLYPYPEPENKPATKPTAVPKPSQPSQPEAPRGQVHQTFYPYPIYPQPEPENQPATKPTAVAKPSQPSKPEVPQGQVYQPFYPNPLYPYPEPENKPATKPTAVPKPSQPSQPEAPQGQVYQPFYPNPLYPYPDNKPATKPTAVAKPSQPSKPEVPQGQVYQPFYPNPLYPYPEPENQPATKPTAVPKPSQPSQPEAPQGQVHQTFYPYPIYPQPEPENQPATKPTAVAKPSQPSKPEVPQGQVYQPFYSNPLYPYPDNQPATKPTAVAKPSQPSKPEVPQGQVYQPFYPNPLYPYPEPENKPATKPTAVPKPSQPEAPQGQVHQPFYPYPIYPQPEPENQPATKPTAVPKPSQPSKPEVPQGQVYQSFYPNPLYPYPFYLEPENQPATKPTAVAKPSQPSKSEVPQGQVYQPFYPNPLYPYPENKPATKPTAVAKPSQPPQPDAPQGQVHQPFYPYPIYPQPDTLPPATSTQQPQQVTIPASGQHPLESALPQPSKGVVPQDPQQGSSYNSPVYCPKSCPSGFSNCCLQIAFHQHLHHIVPPGPGSKDAIPVYPGLPFLPSVAYPGFGNSFGSTPLIPKPTEAATAAPISPQSLPSGNEKQPYLQPPDGNPAALPGSNLGKPTNPKLMYPYFAPNSLYPIWSHPPQNEDLPQRQSPAQYIVPSKSQAPGIEPVNPMLQYEPYNVQPPKWQGSKLSAGDLNNPSGSHLMSLIIQNLQKQQNKPTAKELQPSNTKSHEPKRPTHPLLANYYMLQDAQAPTLNKLAVHNNSTQPQPFVSGPKKSTTQKLTVNINPEPKSYVLLQHGPPGREPNNFSESPLPFRDWVHDASFLAQNLARQSSKPQHSQNVKPPQGKPQHPKWLGKGMPNPLPGNVNYMPKHGEKSESLPLPFSTSDGPHFVPLPQDPTFSAAHLKPKFDSFKDFVKSMTNLGSSQTVPPHIPGTAFQRWSPATDY